MELWLMVLLVVAIIALSGWGYGYYSYRPVAVADVAAGPAAGPSPLIHLIGIVGLMLLIAFFVMWMSGFHFNMDVVPPT